MTKKIYTGVNHTASQCKKIYIGVNNTARKIKKGYIGIDGIARLFYISNYIFTWKKYSMTYQAVVSGSGSSTLSNTTRYFGTTYSLNSNTGVFTVNQTTSRSRTRVAIGDCFISLSTSSVTKTGTTVNVVTGQATSSNGYTLTYDVITAEGIKDTYIENVTNEDPQTYPLNGIQNGYWYEMYDPDHTITYSGDYLDEIVYMDQKYYRLLTLTSSGSLSLDKSVQADIWCCGGGGNGTNEYAAEPGGAGAFAQGKNNITLQNATAIIGAAGSVGGTSSLVTDTTLGSSTTYSTNLGGFEVIQKNASDYCTAAIDYFSGIVNNGVNATQTTENYSGSASTSSANRFICRYYIGLALPTNSVIERVYCQVNGHAENTSQSSEYMCVQLKSGDTELSSQVNFKSIGTSNTTISIEATTLPTVSQLSTMVLECTVGRYGGAINGATCYIQYKAPEGICAGGGNIVALGNGGTGAGTSSYYSYPGYGDQISKYPFDSNYFVYSFCDGGGGAGYYVEHVLGYDGGINGSDGKILLGWTGYAGGDGNYYGGKGGASASGLINATNATGYGSGGGSAGYYNSMGTAGNGYQGVCFIRIPLAEEIYEQQYELPTGYTQYEYLQCESTDEDVTLDLGFIPNRTNTIVCDFQLTATTSYKRYIYCIDPDYQAANDNFGFYAGSSTDFKGTVGENARSSSNLASFSFSSAQDTQRHTISQSYSSATLTTGNSSTTKSYVAKGDTSAPLQLFHYYPPCIKIYSFKVYSRNVLIRNFVPVLSPQSKAGLFDFITNTFYPYTSENGDGELIVGGNIIS